MIVHATCVARDGNAVLLCGASGAGKSDLALRLLDADWQLVSDDRVHLQHTRGAIVTSSIPAIRGLLEVRGLGIVTVPDSKLRDSAQLAGSINLVASWEQLERMPDTATTTWLDIDLPQADLFPFEASSVLKIAYHLDRFLAGEATDGTRS